MRRTLFPFGQAGGEPCLVGDGVALTEHTRRRFYPLCSLPTPSLRSLLLDITSTVQDLASRSSISVRFRIGYRSALHFSLAPGVSTTLKGSDRNTSTSPSSLKCSTDGGEPQDTAISEIFRASVRSEERRVGKERRSRRPP